MAPSAGHGPGREPRCWGGGPSPPPPAARRFACGAQRRGTADKDSGSSGSHPRRSREAGLGEAVPGASPPPAPLHPPAHPRPGAPARRPCTPRAPRTRCARTPQVLSSGTPGARAPRPPSKATPTRHPRPAHGSCPAPRGTPRPRLPGGLPRAGSRRSGGSGPRWRREAEAEPGRAPPRPPAHIGRPGGPLAPGACAVPGASGGSGRPEESAGQELRGLGSESPGGVGRGGAVLPGCGGGGGGGGGVSHPVPGRRDAAAALRAAPGPAGAGAAAAGARR